VSCVLSAIVYTCALPFQYTLDYNYDGSANDLSFWDSYGPFIFYALAIITVMWRTAQTFEYISPREHELLFHFMKVTRPAQRTDNRDRHLLNDVTALLNVSAPVRTSTYHFAQQHNFFDLITTTHRLTSAREFRGKGPLIWLRMTVLCMPFFAAMNVENFLAHHAPAYVAADQGAPKRLFCWASEIVSLCLLFGFVWIWETMFVRLSAYKENVKCLRDVLVRDHKTESMDLGDIESLSSWGELQQFVTRKGTILFASIEPALLSLWLLSMLSWVGFLFCFYEGRGYEDEGFLSDGAWWCWTYLALLTLFESGRMVFWVGLEFTRITRSIDAALKAQLVTMSRTHMNRYIGTKHMPTVEERLAMAEAQNLLQNMNRSDNLLATAAWSLLTSAVPTIGNPHDKFNIIMSLS